MVGTGVGDIGAIIGIADVAIRACLRIARFIEESKHSGEVLSSLRSRATALKELLEAVRKAAKERTDRVRTKSISDDEVGVWRVLSAAVVRCVSTVEKMEAKLQSLGQDGKEPNLPQRAILQLKLEVSGGGIARLERDIQADIEAMQLLFTCLSPFMHEETLTALYESGEKTQQYLAKIEHAIGRVLEALIPQALPLRHPEKKLETSPTKIEPDAERSEDDDPDLQLMKETIQVARSLADTISNRGSVVGRSSSGQVAVYRRVSPEVDHEASDEEFSMPEDSASNEEFPVGFRASLMPMSMTMTSLDELPDAHNERFGAFRHESSHGGQGIGENLPAELMTQLLDNYILAAEADLRARRFPEAQQNLFHATQKGERRESIYSYPFDEKLKIDIIQAAVHTELEEFDVAGPMLDSLVPLTGEDSLKRGELYYLKAKLYRAQYRRTQDAALLEGLEEAAERSYSFALNSDVFPKPYLCQSKDILVEVFEWKGDSVGADSIRDLHPPVSTPVPNHLDDVAADQPAKASARFINGRHYSLGSQAARRVPSLSTVQSAYSRDDRTMSVGSMPTGTAPTSYLRPIASAGLIDRIQDGDLKTVKMLLTIGANIEQVDEVTGLTPLLIAARCQHTEICRVLLTNKADVHAKSRDGRSVLHIALSRRGGEDLIPVLLEHEADPNIADEDGKTPLHYCAKSNKRLAAKHLLDAKAEKEALTKTTKETALQLAIRRNNPALTLGADLRSCKRIRCYQAAIDEYGALEFNHWVRSVETFMAPST